MRLFFVLLLAAACTPKFDSPSLVTDLRVLAVRAEPPEVLADLDAGTLDPVDISVLVADPFAPDAGVMTGLLCQPTTNGQCPVGSSLPLPQIVHAVDQPFTYHFDIPLADQIRKVLANPALKAAGGFRVQFEFDVSDGDPHGIQKASKLVVLNAKEPGYAPNHTPLLDRINVSNNAVTVGALKPGDTLKLAPNVPLGLRPVPADGSIETYTATDFNGVKVQLTEAWTYAFYTTPGCDFDRDTAEETLPARDAPPDGFTRITASAAGLSGTFWIVVRDGRGGSSWLKFPWSS